MTKRNGNPITLVALAWIAFILAMALNRREAAPAQAQPLDPSPPPPAEEPIPEPQKDPVDQTPEAIAAPYTDFILTQGIHGASYGQAAIDISAGKGVPVLSPINGVVTGLYVDPYGNTTLIIENDVYAVTLLHGDYSVTMGEQVQLGQQVGVEWNNGYTLDLYGNLCTGRDCGYHTHLNIFDKRTGENANPLALLGIQ